MKMYYDFYLEEHHVTVILLDEAEDFIVKRETFTTLKQAERFMELISTTFPAAS